MNLFYDALTPVIAWVWKASWQSAILVALVLVIQTVWRERLGARWRYALWLLVVARLALPFSPPSQCSLFNYVRLRPAVEIPGMAPTVNDSPASEVLAQADTASKPNQPSEPLPSAPAASTMGAASSGNPASEISPKGSSPPPLRNAANPSPTLPSPKPSAADSAVSPRAPATTPQEFPLPPNRRQLSWPRLLPLAWLAGALILAGRLAWECAGLAWAVRQARPVDDPALLAVLEKCRRQMGVSALCPLRSTSRIGSPALYGLWRTEMLVPASFIGHFTAEEWRHIFLHELAHQRRRDPLVNWLLAVLQILHWFNPLIWIGFHRMRADRELACDSLVLASADQAEAKAYGHTIIKVMESFAITTPLPGLVGLLEDKRQAERRVRMIARHRPGMRGSWSFGIVLAVLAIAGLSDALPDATGLSGLPEPSTPIVEEASIPAPASPTNSEKDTNAVYLVANIVDVENSAPIFGALVHATIEFENAPIQHGQLTTDPDGLCKIPLPKVRHWMTSIALECAHTNYAPKTFTMRRLYYNAEVSPRPAPQFPNAVTLQMSRGNAIGGCVRDDQGRPVAQARVQLTRGTTPGEHQFTPSYEHFESPWLEDLAADAAPTQKTMATTDSNGRWQFPHFPTDVNWLELEVARPDGAREFFATRSDEEVDDVFAPWYSRQTAGQLDLADLRQINAIISLSKGVSLSGKVVDAQGKPIGGAILREGREFNLPYANLAAYRTDAQGRFLLPHRQPGKIVLTASASGLACASLTVTVQTNDTNVLLQLPAMRPLRARVVDMEDAPIPGATMAAQASHGHVLRWSGITDADGWVTWSNAPLQEAEYLITAPGRRPLAAALTPDSEQTLALGKTNFANRLWWLRVEDADTHQPIERFDVCEGTNILAHGTHGRVLIQGGNVSHIKADGYRITSHVGLRGNTDNALRVLMYKQPLLNGVVLSPDDQPLANAEIRVLFNEASVSMLMSPPGYNTDIYHTDAKGRYGIPLPRDNNDIGFVHESGCYVTSVEKLKLSPNVHLQAWGRLEGQFKIGSQAGTNCDLRLDSFRYSNPYSGNFNVLFKSDRAGGFHLDKIPSGEYVLHRDPNVHIDFHQRLFSPDFYPLHLLIEAGKTTQIQYGGTGRSIKGQILSEPFDRRISWSNDMQLLELKVAKPAGIPKEFPSGRFLFGSRLSSETTPERIAYARALRFYCLEVDRKGDFTAQDIPPGTYWLKIRLSARGSLTLSDLKPIAFLQREVVIPEAQAGHEEEPVDLGIIKVPCNLDEDNNK